MEEEKDEGGAHLLDVVDFFGKWWLVLAGGIVFLGSLWWGTGINSRLRHNEDNLQRMEDTMEKLLAELDDFKEVQQTHYSQDLTYKAELKGQVEALVHEIRGFNQEAHPRAPQKPQPRSVTP